MLVFEISMSHIIYYASIEEHLFLLEQLAHGSQSTVRYLYETLDTKKTEDYSISEFELSLFGFEGFEYGYWDYLHKMVSDYLIQCATRTRIIQDISDLSTEDPSYCPDKEAFEAYSNVANLIEGCVALSLRECCNKIIHAKSLKLISASSTQGDFEYWNGACLLSGDQQGKPWKIELDIKKWVLAMRLYLSIIRHL